MLISGLVPRSSLPFPGSADKEVSLHHGTEGSQLARHSVWSLLLWGLHAAAWSPSTPPPAKAHKAIVRWWDAHKRRQLGQLSLGSLQAHPSVPLSDSRNRGEAVPWWAVPEQVASHVGPGRRGPGQRKGVGARVSVPGDRGSQLDLAPLRSQWADLAPGLADHVLSKVLLGQWASGDWVARLLLLKRGQLKRPQANQRRLYNIPLLHLFSMIYARFSYHHLHLHPIPNTPPLSSHALSGRSPRCKRLPGPAQPRGLRP